MTKNRCKLHFGVTRGGPTPGKRFAIRQDQQFHFVPTPNCPFYAGAYYTLRDVFYPTGEQVATFSHNMEREKYVESNDAS